MPTVVLYKRLLCGKIKMDLSIHILIQIHVSNVANVKEFVMDGIKNIPMILLLGLLQYGVRIKIFAMKVHLVGHFPNLQKKYCPKGVLLREQHMMSIMVWNMSL